MFGFIKGFSKLFYRKPDERFAQDYERVKRRLAKRRTDEINARLPLDIEFPKTHRALEFYKSRPLMGYNLRSNVLFGFLKEIGVDINTIDEIGNTEEEIKNWFRKAEAVITPEVAASFKDIDRMTRP